MGPGHLGPRKPRSRPWMKAADEAALCHCFPRMRGDERADRAIPERPADSRNPQRNAETTAMTAVLLWLFSEELQASPVKPPFPFQSGSKNVDVSKPQQVSSYHAQVPHFQPEHRAKTRHKIKVVRYRLDPWSQIWLKSEVESYHVDPDSHVMGHQLEPQQKAQAIRHQAAPQFQAQRQIQPNEGTNQGGSQSRSLVVDSNWGQLPFQPQKRPYLAEPQNQGQLFSYQTEPQNQKELFQPAPHVLVQSAPYQLEPMTQTKELFYLNKPLSQMASIQAEPQIQVQGKPNQIKSQTHVQGQTHEVAPQAKLVSFHTDPRSQVHGLSYQAQLQSQRGSFHTEPKIQDRVLPYQGDHLMAPQGMSYQEDPQSQMTSCQAEPEIQTQGAIYQVEPQMQMEPHIQGQDLLYQAEHQTPAAREVSYKVDPLYQMVFHEAEAQIQSQMPSVDADPQSMTHSMSDSQPQVIPYQTKPQVQGQSYNLTPQVPSEVSPSYQSEECAFLSEDQDFEPPSSA